MKALTHPWRVAAFCCLAMTLPAQQLPHSQVAVIGRFAAGPVDVPVTVSSTDAVTPFDSGNAAAWPAETQLRWFFRNGGTAAEVIRLDPGRPLAQALRGSFAPPRLSGTGLVRVLSDLGMLVIPELSEVPAADRDAVLASLKPLAESRHFLLLLDPPSQSTSVSAITAWAGGLPADLSFALLSFPRLLIERRDLPGGTSTALLPIGGSGAIAAITARNDAVSGLWTTPTSLPVAAAGVETVLTSTQSGDLNAAHINPIRFFSGSGHRLFGFRTRNTMDAERRFVSVNRLLQWTRHSLTRGMAPVAANAVNDAALWTNLRQRADDFCADLFRQGSLAGSSPSEAWFVRCDATTTTVSDVSNRRVNVIVGLATTLPAEFTILQITLGTADPARQRPVVETLMVRPSAGQWHFYFPTTPGFSFVFEHSGNLTSWTTTPAFAGDGSWQKRVFNATPVRRLFRVRVP